MDPLPMAHVPGASFESALDGMIEEWRRLRPQEAAAWPEAMRRQREALANDKGFSQSGALMAAFSVPQFIHIRIGQWFGNMNWVVDHPEAINTVLRALPQAKMTSTNGMRFASDNKWRR